MAWLNVDLLKTSLGNVCAGCDATAAHESHTRCMWWYALGLDCGLGHRTP